MKIRIYPEDAIFSKYVRTRDKWICQRCGAQHEEGSQGLHCSHFWGRGKWTTRFDDDNCSSICFGCHNYFHANPEEHRKWKLKQLGEKRFKNLMIRANMIGKKDHKLALIIAKKLLEEELKKP